MAEEVEIQLAGERFDKSSQSGDNNVARAGLDFVEELGRSAVLTPIQGAIQLTDHLLGKPNEVQAPPETTHASGGLDGFARQAGSAIGSALPFVAASIVTRHFLPMGSGRLASFGAGAALGFGYDAAFHPVYGKDDYWSTKFHNAAVSALTVGAMSSFAPGLPGAAQSRLSAIGRGAFTGFSSGAAGGVLNAEADSLVGGHGFAQTDRVFQSALTFGLTGAALGGIGGTRTELAKPLESTKITKSLMETSEMGAKNADVPWYLRAKTSGEKAPVVVKGDDGSILILDGTRFASFKNNQWQDGIAFHHDQIAEFNPVKDVADVYRTVRHASDALETGYGQMRQDFLSEVKQQYAPVDQAKITDALTVAEDAHLGQLRKPHLESTGRSDPYIIHPVRAARILMSEIGQKDPNAVVAALLHDVVEDSGGRYTMPQMDQRFGPEVGSILRYVTKAAPNEEITVEQLHDYHTALEQAPQMVREVKLADRLDNIREALLVDRPKFQNHYLTETRDQYIPLAQITNPYYVNELTATCDRLAQLLSGKK